jgi:hypothetical protein
MSVGCAPPCINDLQWHVHCTQFLQITHSLITKMTHVYGWKREKSRGTQMTGSTRRNWQVLLTTCENACDLGHFGVKRLWPATNVFHPGWHRSDMHYPISHYLADNWRKINIFQLQIQYCYCAAVICACELILLLYGVYL